MFLKVMEVVFVLLALVLCVTQLIIPAYRGQKLFPLFRRQGKLEEELEDAVQESEEQKVQKKIDKLHNIYNKEK